MKTLIFFREGLSGHYLKSIIDDTADPIGFRVDPWYPGIYRDELYDPQEDCACLHPDGVDVESVVKEFDLVLNIQVYQKIYHAIYNNFYKKFLVENPTEQDKFKSWTDDPVYWYDRTYYNIKEYYHLHAQDQNKYALPNVVNFDHLLEDDYIADLLEQYFSKSINNNTKRIIAEYRSHQLQYELTKTGQSMADIVSALPDQAFIDSPWFASYCIFKYETNNNLLESQRTWSIDLMPHLIDRQILLSIADQYS
jgi:hypothetical protein